MGENGLDIHATTMSLAEVRGKERFKLKNIYSGVDHSQKGFIDTFGQRSTSSLRKYKYVRFQHTGKTNIVMFVVLTFAVGTTYCQFYNELTVASSFDADFFFHL
jgi:hypothetical protein